MCCIEKYEQPARKREVSLESLYGPLRDRDNSRQEQIRSCGRFKELDRENQDRIVEIMLEIDLLEWELTNRLHVGYSAFETDGDGSIEDVGEITLVNIAEGLHHKKFANIENIRDSFVKMFNGGV